MRPALKQFSSGARRRIKHTGRWAGIDFVVVILAYTAAYSTRSLISPLDYVADIPFILVASGATIPFLYLFGVYNRIWSQTSGHGISVILGAVFFTTLVMVVAEMVVTPRPLPLSVVLMANVLAAGFSLALAADLVQ